MAMELISAVLCLARNRPCRIGTIPQFVLAGPRQESCKQEAMVMTHAVFQPEQVAAEVLQSIEGVRAPSAAHLPCHGILRSTEAGSLLLAT